MLGRVSFEDMRAFWPEQSDDITGNTSYLNSADKFVVSSTMEDPLVRLGLDCHRLPSP